MPAAPVSLDQLPVTSTLSWGLLAGRFSPKNYKFTMSRWPEAKTLKFIRIYKQNRCLWDPSMPEYKNKVLRERACQNMIQQMQAKDCTTVYSIKHKIKNLRSTYHQELKKVRDSLASGEGSHDKPTLSWFYEMHSFIGGINSERRSSTDQPSDAVVIDVPMESNTDEVDEQDSESVKQENSVTDLEAQETYTEPEVQLINEVPPSKKRRKELKQTNPINYSERTSATVNSNNVEDEFYYFALNVAAQLRQLPLHEALQMQVLIQSKLLAARTKVLKTVKIRREDYEESEEDSD